MGDSMSIKEDIEKVEQAMKEIEKESFAMEFLSDYKRSNKRMFVIIMVILTMWFLTIGYLVYILNDIGVEETITTQEIQDVDTIENSNIANGDIYGEDKTNKEN